MLSAVISKMKIKTVRSFGDSGMLTTLDCVCENDLMAAYAGAEEDRCFTKYSPWGEAVLSKSLLSGNIDMMQGHPVYVVVTRRSDGFKCGGALAVIEARVECRTDYGGARSSVVEVCQSYCGEKVGFNMKTAIDNPPAVEFFELGSDNYRVAFYDAETFSRDTALADVYA
jgi:hypothetical protein